MLRSYWTSRGTEGRPLAAVALDGGEVELSAMAISDARREGE